MKKVITMKLSRLAISWLLALMFVGAIATISVAEEPANTKEKSSSSAEQVGAGWREAPWRFHVNVYGWLPHAPVDIKVDGNKVASAPESLDNILDDLEMTAMLEFEVHKGRIGVFASPVYYDGKDPDPHPGQLL